MQKVLRLGSLGLAATLMISACAPAVTTPPPATPEADAPYAGELVAEEEAPAFPEDVKPLPLTQEAPQPPVTTNEQGLILPNGGNLTLDQIYQDIPSQIPQDEASQWLSPLPGAIPQGFGTVPTAIDPAIFGAAGYVAYPGVIPALLSYNALARCLYFRYLNFWIPYYLVGNVYYPYAYSPYYDAVFAGYYAYPIFYAYGGYCYPYYFLSKRYCYGYPDWEYYWPSYRAKHRHHRYDDDFKKYRNRWNSRHLRSWLESRRRDSREQNWRERAREYRRGGQDERPGYQRPGSRPGGNVGDRGGNRGGERRDRGDRRGGDTRYGRPDSNRPNPNVGQRPDRGGRETRSGGTRQGGRQERGVRSVDGDDRSSGRVAPQVRSGTDVRNGRSTGGQEVRSHRETRTENRQQVRQGRPQQARQGSAQPGRGQGGRNQGRVRPAAEEPDASATYVDPGTD